MWIFWNCEGELRHTWKYKHFVRCIYYRIVCCLYHWIQFPAFNSFVWRFWIWFFSFSMFCPNFGHTKWRIICPYKRYRNWSESHSQQFTTWSTPQKHTVNLVSLSLSMWTLCWCSHNAFLFPINHESHWISNFDSQTLIVLRHLNFSIESPTVWHTNQHRLFVHLTKLVFVLRAIPNWQRS